VGRSGSGKSTLVSLISRFYDIEDGEILLDGQSLSDYTLKSLREQISLVTQDLTLFNDTIEKNIAYGALSHFGRDDVIKAAESAYAMEFINDQSDGLDTRIGEDGVLLSGGQRQRLAIARALLKNSPILILDEATSALDSESEQKIQSALENVMQGRTTLVIAHRLSTIENADLIVVMDEGSIIETGSHDELIAQEGFYNQLHKKQFDDNE
jgi:subfamily B ATP-binding cassette protein MsbA